MYLVPAKDSATSPVWSATHAAPAAASAINTRNRTMRSMKILLPGLFSRLGEIGHGGVGKFARGGQRGVARIRLVEPGLHRRTRLRRQALQLAPRVGSVVAQRERGRARDD